MPRTEKPQKGPEYRMRGIHRRVIETLGEAIVLGTYTPGALLPREGDLAIRFKVSRTAVREAIKVLAAKGLVEARRKLGTRVRSEDQWNHFDPEIISWRLTAGFDDKFIRDLIELRKITEPAAARMAATRATPADIASMEAALREMDASLHDRVAWAKADVGFHMTIFLASRNNFMASLWFTIRQMLEITFRLFESSGTPRLQSLEEDIAFHRVVFEHISRGEAELAAEATMDLIAAAERELMEARRGRKRPRVGTARRAAAKAQAARAHSGPG